MAINFDEKTKTWTVSYRKRHPITRQPINLRRIKISTQAEAKRIFNSLVLQVEEKIKDVLVPRWGVALDEFILFMKQKGLGGKTIDNYEICLRAHTLESWKNRSVDSISSIEIRELLKIKVGHRSASHQKSLLKFIRAVFSYCVEMRYLNYNPTPLMKFRIGDKIKLVLTASQLKSFLEKAKELQSEWYPHWVMASYTGLRNGELYALTWDKVNLEVRQILVDCSWTNKDGFKSTKSGDDRVIEIAPNLLVILKKL